MDFLTDFSKLFGRKIISYFLWIYVYCFLFSLDSNIFLCSFLKKELINVEQNIFFFLVLLIIYTVYTFFYKNNSNKSKINNFININYYINLFKNQNLIYSIKLFVNTIKLNLNNVFFSNKNNIFTAFILTTINLFKNSSLVWYPIYKAYSIFGYYKSTRLKFIDLKNENLKRFKY